MDKQPERDRVAEVVDKALGELERPSLRTARSAKRLATILGDAKKTGTVVGDDIGRCVVELLDETGIRSFLKAGPDPRSNQDDVESSTFGFFFLLVLLLLLLALADPGSDAYALLEDLLRQVLDALGGGAVRPA